MAEVLEPGTSPTGWSTRLDCPKCSALIRLNADDITARWDQAGWGGDPGNWTYAWTCPSCKRGNHVGLRGELVQIPMHVLASAEKAAGPRR